MKKDFAVIFDLNGTLVDTEIAHGKAYREVLKKHGIEFSLPDFSDHWTRQGKKLADYLTKIERHDLLHLEKDLVKEKDQIFDSSFAANSTLMPFARETLSSLKHEGFILGADSSTSRDNLEKLLKHFELFDFFDILTSRDTPFEESEYGDHKSKTARLKFLVDSIKLPAYRVAMVGDAEKDIQGANRAGIKAIAVPNKDTANNNFNLADKVVKDLSEITSELILSLLNPWQ